MKQTLILNGIIFFYIIQRFSELLISNENEKWLIRENEAVEVDPKESFRMRIFHVSWFVSLIIESNIKREFQPTWISLGLYFLLALGMGIRLHTMEKLKQFWTIKVLAMKNQTISSGGLYQYYRHPNYAVVVMELICLPLLMKAYFTMIIFSVLNFFILSKRIELEESTLMKQSNYKDVFFSSKLIFLFMFLMGTHFAQASEVFYSHKTYDEAKKSVSYVKFKSESTKLGLITTSFDGYIREMKVNYNLEGNLIKQLDAVIPVKSLDTDNSARNEKMYNEILDVGKFPNIIVQLEKPVQLNNGEQTAEMIFTIKDKKITKAVKFNVNKVNDHIMLSGHTVFGLKEMGLPDPSIAIAKVRDNFDFDFSLGL